MTGDPPDPAGSAAGQADSLAPGTADRLARARVDLRNGLPVLLTDPGLGWALAAPLETLSRDRLAALRAAGRAEVVLTARRAVTLKARPYDGDVARIPLPDWAGLDWLQALADPGLDLETPMKGPLPALRDGDAQVARAAVRLAKEARLLPAVLVVTPQDPESAAPEKLTELTLADVAHLPEPPKLDPVVSARLPLSVAPEGRLHVFRPEDGGEEHYAMEIGNPARSAPVLTRLHSACFTGDLMGSLKCDCGPQLRGALAQMAAEGTGVLLYLNQEGRGIGLANKMRAYALQDQGFDTVEANHRLGFEDDERDFRLGAQILRQMGFTRARLMTNNPAKVARLEESGITVVERVPLIAGKTSENASYLATKAAKSGHLF
ncbi:MAG: GTP cyclohydrolase II [Pseudomonadota bacterium]